MPAGTGAVHTFAGSPLHRAGNERRDAAWLARQAADPAARFMVLHRLRAGMDRSAEGIAIRWRARAEVEPLLAAGGMLLLLGLEGGAPRFAVDADPGVPDEAPPFDGDGTFIDVRTAAMRGGAADAAILAQARSMIDWHARHRFCAVCGRPTRPSEGGYARRCTDEACGASHFPRTDPVTIMLVMRAGRLLLGRQRRFPKGVYSALAGFVEPGENIEEAVRREVLEEAGIRIGRVSYHSSQPWPFPSSLMIGCHGEAENDDIAIDPDELEDARWFDRGEVEAMVANWRNDEVLRMPPPISIAHQMARHWLMDE